MTIVEGDDGLVILNPVRLSEDRQVELDALGRVAHLVKLSDAHFVDEPFYCNRYRPAFWTLPGANLRGLRSDHTFGPDGPVSGGVVINFPQATRAREAAYFVPCGGGTLVTCDAVQNPADTERLSFLARVVTPLLGFRGGVRIPPMWQRLQKVSRPMLRPMFQPIADMSFENLVTGHGPPVIGGADRVVRAAISSACG
jgi:hypothetical protein